MSLLGQILYIAIIIVITRESICVCDWLWCVVIDFSIAKFLIMNILFLLSHLTVIRAVDNDLVPIAQNILDSEPLSLFRPNIYQDSGSCAPHVACNSGKSSECTTFVKAIPTCEKPLYGGQLVGRQALYFEKFVVLYTAYSPFDYDVLTKSGVQRGIASQDIWQWFMEPTGRL